MTIYHLTFRNANLQWMIIGWIICWFIFLRVCFCVSNERSFHFRILITFHMWMVLKFHSNCHLRFICYISRNGNQTKLESILAYYKWDRRLFCFVFILVAWICLFFNTYFSLLNRCVCFLESFCLIFMFNSDVDTINWN